MTKDCHKGNNCRKAFKGLYKTKQLRNHILTHLTLISHIISTSKTFIDFIGTVSNQVQSIIICFKTFVGIAPCCICHHIKGKGSFRSSLQSNEPAVLEVSYVSCKSLGDQAFASLVHLSGIVACKVDYNAS